MRVTVIPTVIEMFGMVLNVKLKESEKKDKYIELAWELKKLWNMECDDYTDCNRCSRYSHQNINKDTGGHGNNRRSGDHQN